jgi:erythromycin esterase-like protein
MMLTDERYKQLMAQVGMPDSRSLLQALKQAAMESAIKEREECARLIEPSNPQHDWTEYAATKAECARRIRERY